MNNFKKIIAFALAIVVVMSCAACSAVPKSMSAEWGYKTSSEEYPIGVYIYSLFSAYNQAYSVISEAQGDDFDKEASIMDIESSFDETGEVYACSEWIKKEADKITRTLIALDQAIEEYGIELDEKTVSSAYEQARMDWYLGPYYETYAAYGYSSTPYSSMMEPYGISFESFYQSTYLSSVKQNALFNYLYEKGGIKEVAESEYVEYFENNYTKYSYFTANLCESTLDESGKSTTVALPDSEITKIKDALASYVKNINIDGMKFDAVATAYKTFAGLENDPTVTNTENLDNSSLGSEIAKAIRELPEGEAGIVYVGEKDSQIAYFIYKSPIKAETKDYLANDTNHTSILQAMKNEEFLKYVEGLTDKAVCELNESVIARYEPAMFEEK